MENTHLLFSLCEVRLSICIPYIVGNIHSGIGFGLLPLFFCVPKQPLKNKKNIVNYLSTMLYLYSVDSFCPFGCRSSSASGGA